MPMPVSAAVLRSELQGARDILDQWIKVFEQGYPGEDYPVTGDMSEDVLELQVHRLTGELLVCAGKCENLAGVLGERS